MTAAERGPVPAADVYVPEIEARDRMGVEAFLRERGYDPRCGDAVSPPSASEVAAAIGGADVVAVALGRVDDAVMAAAPGLRLIVKCGIGVDCIEVEAARRRGIPVLRAGGVNFDGVAEWVIGTAILHLRRLRELDRLVRERRWLTDRPQLPGIVPGLKGRTIGLFGVGSIGSRTAELARVHGMRVIGFDPYVDEAPGVELVARDALFREADVVSVHAVLTEESRHAIGAAELALMKPDALLVNAARGPIVDQAALADALRARAIGGAALDVFEVEPLEDDSPLMELDNVLLSPHVAGATDSGYKEIGGLSAALIDAFLRGEPVPRNCVVVQTGDLVVAQD